MHITHLEGEKHREPCPHARKTSSPFSLRSHLLPILADVLENLSRLNAWKQPERQYVQRGCEKKLPFPRQDRRTVQKPLIGCDIRILLLEDGCAAHSTAWNQIHPAERRQHGISIETGRKTYRNGVHFRCSMVWKWCLTYLELLNDVHDCFTFPFSAAESSVDSRDTPEQSILDMRQ